MGQINPDSVFGSFLKKFASDPNVKSIVDIGAWNGLGSTKCIMDGICDRSDVHVYSYENKKEFWEVARKNWDNNDKISVIYGRLTNRMMSREEIESHPKFLNVKDHYTLWYQDDVKCFEESPVIEPPEKVDFVVFDGGEFSTQGDWDVISNYKPLYIALDDTHVIKCSNIESELEKNPNYIKIASGTDRNGWSIFKYTCLP